MSKISSKNTSPELLFRKILWKEGFRYRIHDKSIIGTPDVSNKSKKIAVFVDGCFWHGCPRCYTAPKTNEANVIVTMETKGLNRGLNSRFAIASGIQNINKSSIIILKAKFFPVINGKSMEPLIISGRNGTIKRPIFITII